MNTKGLTILTWNVLLPNSVDGWWLYKYYGPGVPDAATAWEARQALMKERLLAADPDVICLQETSDKSFASDFAFLRDAGYDCAIMSKGRMRPATFWKRKRLELCCADGSLPEPVAPPPDVSSPATPSLADVPLPSFIESSFTCKVTYEAWVKKTRDMAAKAVAQAAEATDNAGKAPAASAEEMALSQMTAVTTDAVRGGAVVLNGDRILTTMLRHVQAPDDTAAAPPPPPPPPVFVLNCHLSAGSEARRRLRQVTDALDAVRKLLSKLTPAAAHHQILPYLDKPEDSSTGEAGPSNLACASSSSAGARERKPSLEQIELVPKLDVGRRLTFSPHRGEGDSHGSKGSTMRGELGQREVLETTPSSAPLKSTPLSDRGGASHPDESVSRPSLLERMPSSKKLAKSRFNRISEYKHVAGQEIATKLIPEFDPSLRPRELTTMASTSRLPIISSAPEKPPPIASTRADIPMSRTPPDVSMHFEPAPAPTRRPPNKSVTSLALTSAPATESSLSGTGVLRARPSGKESKSIAASTNVGGRLGRELECDSESATCGNAASRCKGKARMAAMSAEESKQADIERVGHKASKEEALAVEEKTLQEAASVKMVQQLLMEGEANAIMQVRTDLEVNDLAVAMDNSVNDLQA